MLRWERLDIAQEAYWDMTDWPRYSASRHSPTTAEPPFRLTVQVGTETTAVRFLGGAVGLVIDHAREAWRQHGLLIRVPAHWDAFQGPNGSCGMTPTAACELRKRTGLSRGDDRA